MASDRRPETPHSALNCAQNNVATASIATGTKTEIPDPSCGGGSITLVECRLLVVIALYWRLCDLGGGGDQTLVEGGLLVA